MIEQLITTERQALNTIFYAALQSVDPYEAVTRYADEIAITYEKRKYAKLYVLAFGKAASAMAHTLPADQQKSLKYS
jgi:glycerate-2-kinase